MHRPTQTPISGLGLHADMQPDPAACPAADRGMRPCCGRHPQAAQPVTGQHAAEPGPDFRRLLKRLDDALQRLVVTSGSDHGPLAAVYNELWPDGLTMRLERHGDGSFCAHLSGGGRLRFRNWDELGMAAMCMCDRELYNHVRRSS